MTKSRKFSLIRVGDAKRLTKGDGTQSLEINLQPRDVAG